MDLTKAVLINQGEKLLPTLYYKGYRLIHEDSQYCWCDPIVIELEEEYVIYHRDFSD